MINEVKEIKNNANILNYIGVPNVPILLFLSDGTGVSGFNKESWRRIPKEYI